MNFKTWIEQKKVKEQDLIFTRALKELTHISIFNQLCEQMANFQPSFSDGLAFLELGTDLILMGHDQILFENSSDFESWRSAFKKLRYPHTDKLDNQLKEKYEKLPWPYGSKIKFERRGDRAGIELKLFISSTTDLTKILASLERVQQDLNK